MKNYTPLQYIKIDVANQHGLDKLSFEKRIAWFDTMNDDPDIDLDDLVDTAKKPYQLMAGIQAYHAAMAGEPSGHMVGLDACSSGIAIMGVCMGCKTTSRNTGMIGDKRMDMYSEGNKAMNIILGSTDEVPRDDMKQGMMTHFYGSKAEPKAIFGEDTPELQAFHDAQDTVAPGAVWLMEQLLMSWQPMAKEHSWTMVDGFEVVTPVLQKEKSKIEIDELNGASIEFIYEVNRGKEKGLAVAANATHSIDGFLVRELCRRCNYDRYKIMRVKEALEARINMSALTIASVRGIEQLKWVNEFTSAIGIEHIQLNNVVQYSVGYCEDLLALVNDMIEHPPFEVLTVHDEYKCHPNNMNRLRYHYVQIMAELAESNMMASIIGQIRNDPKFNYQKFSTNLGEEIRKSEYFLS